MTRYLAHTPQQQHAEYNPEFEPDRATAKVLEKSGYIRLLRPDELQRADVVYAIQYSDYEFEELYGVFQQHGSLVGIATDLSTAIAAANDSGMEPQFWLV